MRRRALLSSVYMRPDTPDVPDIPDVPSFDYVNYLTIEALETLDVSLSGSDCYYSIDGGGWVLLPAGDSTPTVPMGTWLHFKRYDSVNSLGTFSVSGKFNLRGNCMSMLYGDNAAEYDSVGNRVFEDLFRGSRVVSVDSGFLPATTLAEYCYYNMFNSCKSLVNAPELPATTLDDRCYYSMFQGCTSLVNAPELPATTLADYCYASMFSGCTSLVNAPELPATTLAEYCYYNMFNSCKSLVNAPELPATTLASACHQHMFYGCTSLVNAPELPATTLAKFCYNYMFYGCKKLSYIKALFTTTPSSGYTTNWVNGVASSGTFVKNKHATWNVTGDNGIPTGWTVKTE